MAPEGLHLCAQVYPATHANLVRYRLVLGTAKEVLSIRMDACRSCGGSAANVAKGLAGLGSAHRGIGFAGRVGKTR